MEKETTKQLLMKTFNGKQEAVEGCIIPILEDAGENPADYCVDEIANWLLKDNGHGRCVVAATEESFWEVAGSCACGVVHTWLDY